MKSKEHPFDRLVRLSRFGARLLLAHPALSDLRNRIDIPYHRDEMEAWLAQPASDEAQLNSRVRQLRNRVWAVTAARDLAGVGDLHEVTHTFSDLAETTINAALQFHRNDLAARFGQPIDPDGRPMELTVVAMGKLGGRELNVSSDIDLIFLYPEEGKTHDSASLSHHEFFIRLGRKLIGALSELTADGYVFRVDMRLRPWGESGPLAMSYAMLEEYLVSQGRAWERYAWIKARPIHGEHLEELDAIVRPFVFRKYLDFSAFAAIRDLHAQIRHEVARRDMRDDLKLGPGGIREIEFTAQVFQLIRGGRIPALQIRPTQEVLHLALDTGAISQLAHDELIAAYVFLRRMEHCIQYLDDAQTQSLPSDPDSQQRVAEMMNYSDWSTLLATLHIQRGRVTNHFKQIFIGRQFGPQHHPVTRLWLTPESSAKVLSELGYRNADASSSELRRFKEGLYQRLPESAQVKLNSLIPALIQVAAEHSNADDTLARLMRLVEVIARRTTYLALLTEYPGTLKQLSKLVSASPRAAELITHQPALLDELIDPEQLLLSPDWPILFKRLSQQMDQHATDTGEQMDALRQFKQVNELRLLAQDVAGILSVENVSGHLSSMADGLLAETLKRIWFGLEQGHPAQPKFAIIGYGKLGGKELGYASDLDLIFLYDDPSPDSGVLYARIVRRIITWLCTATPAGILYDTDLRLRPNGASGLLVSSLAAFKSYQLQHAWVWEHQALTRARHICGDQAIGDAFETIRRTILTMPRDKRKLRAEVLAMRQKMHEGHPNHTGLFDLKHDPGGIVDIEFCVQYMILAHARSYPGLLENSGNITLLKHCGDIGLIPSDLADASAAAYRDLRQRYHSATLQGSRGARIPPNELAPHHLQTVARLWRSLFNVDEQTGKAQ
ncbi:MAG: bifunctional [glutamate--ammonia ligase]-adenylyl-L-tyrosine phosphorylase/[glutamate--ammonia-ligase] adenylyltransferase [Thiobacillaceae bacterium]